MSRPQLQVRAQLIGERLHNTHTQALCLERIEIRRQSDAIVSHRHDKVSIVPLHKSHAHRPLVLTRIGVFDGNGNQLGRDQDQRDGPIRRETNALGRADLDRAAGLDRLRSPQTSRR